jgi:hypothetical protein
MHQIWLLVLAATGCATSSAFGTQAIATPNGDGSLEVTAAGGVGLGTPEGALLATADGALGASRTGDLQGRLRLSDEWVTFGTCAGWQLRAGPGASFGSYQSPDLTLQLSGGPHWNLARSESHSTVRVTSVALDATIGYGFRFTNDGHDIRRDGWLVGLGLSLRRDQVTDLDFKGLRGVPVASQACVPALPEAL